MNANYPTANEQIQLAKQYFIKVDTGDTSLLDMFSDDAQVYFPKIGTMQGKTGILRLMQKLTSVVIHFDHDIDSMIFTQASNRLIVEGNESGVLTDGTLWPADAPSAGRYCNVFEFCGNLFSRLHIYADPDFSDKYKDLFPQ